ncbi:hypothetical protein E2C01_032530 [Portunus trituberculatus]|uniref:Uncharacterized protein n=1 Tax=Portunus trituberculatus TaxID=210409 RepID=A0A5B7EW85_PORTR|nr:hypothetical protein [Portunus trituberculatus]
MANGPRRRGAGHWASRLLLTDAHAQGALASTHLAGSSTVCRVHACVCTGTQQAAPDGLVGAVFFLPLTADVRSNLEWNVRPGLWSDRHGSPASPSLRSDSSRVGPEGPVHGLRMIRGRIIASTPPLQRTNKHSNPCKLANNNNVNKDLKFEVYSLRCHGLAPEHGSCVPSTASGGQKRAGRGERDLSPGIDTALDVTPDLCAAELISVDVGCLFITTTTTIRQKLFLQYALQHFFL